MQTPSDSAVVQTIHFAKVALPFPIATSFTYKIPEDLRTKVFVGCRVEVQFGRRLSSGIVVELTGQSDISGIKPIRGIYETYLPDSLLKLTRWIAGYYGCTFGEAAQAVLPPVLRRSRRSSPMSGVLSLKMPLPGDEEVPGLLRRARKQYELARSLHRAGGWATIETVFGEWGFNTSHVKGLLGKGMAELSKTPARTQLDKIEGEVTELSEDQNDARDRIIGAITAGQFRALLLQGVTASGKTELYLRAVKHVLSSGGGCIVLVPEIGLLPQAMARYRRALGDRIAILHSRLTGPERFEIWQRIAQGKCRAVLGPRSAVFSPVQDLRLIVVDEEQDDSYKQEDKPRYHARNVALMRGKNENLTVLLGSATPSAESMHHAKSGRYEHLILPRRVTGAGLPEIRFVDMREEGIEGGIFSSYLVDRLESNIESGRQSILFLNKRGHARFVLCNACGWVAICQNCDISLTYHRVADRLKCHFCGYGQPGVRRCAQCQSARLYFSGVGTQRVELDLSSLFPGVGVLRMDADTTSGKEGHKRVLEKFSTGRFPILIGTQMVAKGHHFPNVSLVGVLFAEESLNYPDFRASERTFRQLVQVAGRAGRASDRGEVVVQTYMPEHHVFTFLKTHDYDGFMEAELDVRRALRYPPFARIILASCSSPNPDALHRVAEAWAVGIRRFGGSRLEVLGPVPPIVQRVKNRYREQLLLKGNLKPADKQHVLNIFQEVVAREPGGRSVELRWDVDPEAFH